MCDSLMFYSVALVFMASYGLIGFLHKVRYTAENSLMLTVDYPVDYYPT